MENTLDLDMIGTILTEWFAREGRDLPWRRDKTSYRVWVSEIMLQQTRVEAVKPYFSRFMQRLPDVRALAEISQEELNKLWEGLGYYSRARNLRRAAQVLVQEYDGQMPADYQSLLSLPGIGSYTAGAIASFAFGIPVAAVDGNVLRVMSRLTGSLRDITKAETKRYFEDQITAFLKTGRIDPGGFNGAIMELGAIVCVPNGEPMCEKCPVRQFCQANLLGLTDLIPVKSPKKARRVEEKTVLILTDGSRFLIEKRPEKGLLAGLYQFPNLPGDVGAEQFLNHLNVGGQPFQMIQGPEAVHVFTHVEWRMKSRIVRAEPAVLEQAAGEKGLLVTKEELLNQTAVPSAFGAYVKLVREL